MNRQRKTRQQIEAFYTRKAEEEAQQAIIRKKERFVWLVERKQLLLRQVVRKLIEMEEKIT